MPVRVSFRVGNPASPPEPGFLSRAKISLAMRLPKPMLGQEARAIHLNGSAGFVSLRNPSVHGTLQYCGAQRREADDRTPNCFGGRRTAWRFVRPFALLALSGLASHPRLIRLKAQHRQAEFLVRAVSAPNYPRRRLTHLAPVRRGLLLLASTDALSLKVEDAFKAI